jgi:hypothetical protein
MPKFNTSRIMNGGGKMEGWKEQVVKLRGWKIRERGWREKGGRERREGGEEGEEGREGRRGRREKGKGGEGGTHVGVEASLPSQIGKNRVRILHTVISISSNIFFS